MNEAPRTRRETGSSGNIEIDARRHREPQTTRPDNTAAKLGADHFGRWVVPADMVLPGAMLVGG